MSTTHDLAEVDLPEAWNAWPARARASYLAATLDRAELLALVACRAEIVGAGVGEDRLRKRGLARVAVELDGGEST